MNSNSGFVDRLLSESEAVDCVLLKNFQPLYCVNSVGYLFFSSHKKSSKHVMVMWESEVNALNASDCSLDSPRPEIVGYNLRSEVVLE